MAKKRVDKKRDLVCKAVLIQTAWRSFIARKRLILLRNATIVLQAHWRGRSARRRFIVLLEEDQKRKQEELERLAAEEKRRKEDEEAIKKEEMLRREAAEALKREQEEQGMEH